MVVNSTWIASWAACCSASRSSLSLRTRLNSPWDFAGFAIIDAPGGGYAATRGPRDVRRKRPKRRAGGHRDAAVVLLQEESLGKPDCGSGRRYEAGFRTITFQECGCAVA